MRGEDRQGGGLDKTRQLDKLVWLQLRTKQYKITTITIIKECTVR